MDLEELNLGQICRTCKCVTPQMRSLFEGYENPHHSPRIDEMLMACASVQVMCGDGLPSQICQICVEQLNSAFVFKRQCEKIDAGFREYANVKVNEIKEEQQNSEFRESLNTLNNLPNEQSSSKENMPDEIPTLVTPKIETDNIQFMDNNQMLLTCRECTKMFTTLEGLRCHKRIHTGSIYKCKQCDKEYTRHNHLQRHEQSHSGRKVHVCRICSKTLTRMEHLKRHLATHLREKPFSCKTCNRGFSRIEYLHNHTSKCKGDTVYPCDICNKALNREDSLEVHKKMHGNQQPKLLTIENLDNIEDHYYQIDQNVDATFSDHSDVDDCFESQMEVTESVDEGKLKEATDFTNHDEKSKVSEVVSIGGRDNDNNESKDIDSEEKRVNDTIESEEMEVKAEVKEEVIVNFNEDEDDIGDNNEMADKNSGNSTDFEYLPKKSMSRKTKHLKRHVSSHSNIKPFCCTVCAKSFSRRDHLNKHQKLHERQNDYECNICQKPFNRADHLAKHKASNHDIGEKVAIMGEKKYECPLCNKGFTTEKSRDVHVNDHNGQKENQCKMCETTFLSKSDLTEHMKFHNKHSKKFLCSECGKSFTKNAYLVNHMRGHRGEKPFKCKYCGKDFLRASELTVHERYHTGEKTHLCTICGKGFGRFVSLTCLNVVGNIRRLQPVHNKENPDDPSPPTISLPKPVVPENVVK
ncbi:hypothetical protein NQ314_017550 [Rhamnusium bicolor]|uniref:Uncharacterized protein n=1 Tax=Rhamnusium bicolor TaxID=1586634 RepID=A0AAV8WUJ3_9CUCU|nr:hypothetical protein NQ314_017550 [Rhamnusium bicolor]